MSITDLLHRRTVRLYAMGQGVILLGAGLMDYFNSTVPLALCGSAGLMLCMPLIKEFGARFLGHRQR